MVETSLSLMRKKSEDLDHPVLYHVVIIDMSGLSLQASSLLPLVRVVRSFLCIYEGPVSVSHRAQGPKKLEIGNKKIKLPTIKVYDRRKLYYILYVTALNRPVNVTQSLFRVLSAHTQVSPHPQHQPHPQTHLEDCQGKVSPAVLYKKTMTSLNFLSQIVLED